MSAVVFGQTFNRGGDEPIPVEAPDFSTVLAIETSEDASSSEYAYDTAVSISSSDKDAVEALGTGLLADQVRGIQAQLDSMNASARVIVVRVEEGETTAATCAAIGEILDGITSIPSAVGKTPRIVLPGRTDWRADAETMNPVLAKLPAALGKILAIAPVDVNALSLAQAIDDRETLNSERIMPIGIKAKVFEGTDSVPVVRPMAPRVAGLFVRQDNAHGGKPFETIANIPIYGIAGLSRDLAFTMFDGATEGQQMLEANISIVDQGEFGVDGAIADGGFVFIGTDAAVENGDVWEQIHQTRGADFITVKMSRITRSFLGPRITADRLEAWLLSQAFMLRDHASVGDILGYTPLNEMFVPDKNSPEEVRLGELEIDIGIEPGPAFKRAIHNVKRYRPAVQGLVSDVVARLSNIT